MTEIKITPQEREQIKEALKNDAKLSKAYKELLDAKKNGKLLKEINPEEIMVTLVAQYGVNAAGLAHAALSRPKDVMDACNQKFSRASGTLKFLTTGKASDEQIAKILNKSVAAVQKDKKNKGTVLPTNRKLIKNTQRGLSFMQKWNTAMTKLNQKQSKKQAPKPKKKTETKEVDGITGAAVKSRSVPTQNKNQTAPIPKRSVRQTQLETTENRYTGSSVRSSSRPQERGNQMAQNQRGSGRQAQPGTIIGNSSSVRTRSQSIQNENQTTQTSSHVDSETIRVDLSQNSPRIPEETWENSTMDNMKAYNAAQKRDNDIQKLYAACDLPVAGGQVDLKTLMEKGLVTQNDIQSFYDKHDGKENSADRTFVSGISAGRTSEEYAKKAYNHARGKGCKGYCLSGVQVTHPDVPGGDDPIWKKYRRPGQKENWACDTYKVLEEKGYVTVSVRNRSTGPQSPEAIALRRTVTRFPNGTVVCFDNQIDATIENPNNPREYYGAIAEAEKRPNKGSVICGHVGGKTTEGLESDGHQSHISGYNPTNYGKYVHFSLAPDTKVSADLAKQLIMEAYDRRIREAEEKNATAKLNAEFLQQYGR